MTLVSCQSSNDSSHLNTKYYILQSSWILKFKKNINLTIIFLKYREKKPYENAALLHNMLDNYLIWL